jgi:hypothetical protein
MNPAAARPGAGGDVHVDRLTLRVTGLDEDAARALARLVAEKLAGTLPPGSAGPGSPLDALAGRIADQVGRALEALP